MADWSNQEELLQSYQKTRQLLLKKIDQLRGMETTNAVAAEIELHASMLSDVDFVMQWLRTGKKPGTRRGIENLSYDQRTIYMNPLMLQSYADRSVAGTHVWVDEGQRKEIEDVLKLLSERERACFEMAYEQGLTHESIAKCLKIKRTTVTTLVRRAKVKIKDYVTSLPVS